VFIEFELQLRLGISGTASFLVMRVFDLAEEQVNNLPLFWRQIASQPPDILDLGNHGLALPYVVFF
jgi:hypothetical protein